ncbi:MAG: hypothetical protein KAV00_00515 [Phycisphaerae bacterium]|nr:hypothetical protein [Phycisphaerae bacterium]
MINANYEMKDVVLFYAGKSLLEQAGNWVDGQPNLFLRLVSSRSRPVVNKALSEASAVIVDITEHPDTAMDVFQYAVGRPESGELAVYTERSHEGLEIFVRSRGVLLLLGPLNPAEWGAFFESLQPPEASSVAGLHSGTERKPPCKTICLPHACN